MAAPTGFGEFLIAWVNTQTADLLPLLGGTGALRVDPWQAARKETLSRVTYTLVSGHDEGALDGPSGLLKERWQIDCWGPLPADARYLARLMAGTRGDRRLDGYRGEVLAGLKVNLIRLIDSRDMSQELGPASDTGNPCIQQDYEVWTNPN
jgi:hypothetical protein